jgi:glutathione S-transferase
VVSRLEIVTDDDGKETFDAKGNPVRVAVWSVRVKVGRTTTSFDLVRGKGSPDKRTPMTEDEVRDEIKRQIGHAAREAARHGMSEAEIAAERQREIAAAAQRQRAEAAKAESARRAAMTEEQIAAEADGEHAFPDGAHALVDIALATGAITEAHAQAERARLDAWRDRTERRKAARAHPDPDVKHAALAAIRAEIGG